MNDYLDPRKSLILYGLNEKINFFIKLYSSKKFPHVLMLSGEKGSGKFTLINHFLTYIFDKDNYNIENYTINIQYVQKMINEKINIDNMKISVIP